jgi:sodium/hydrogen antiporter
VPDLLTGFALIAVVLTGAALFSGLVERAPLSFPMLFLGLGFLLGPPGVGVIEIGPEDHTLEAIGFLVLALVLFLDAMRLRAGEIGSAGIIPMLSLGPGTLIIILIVALGAHFLIGTDAIQSLLIGTILASTDPVVLRDVVRDERIPRSIRRALSIEAGTNDIVVLPILLVLIALATADSGGMLDWGVFAVQIFLLGPLVGFLIGAGGAWLMGRVDARHGIRREYQALYGIGLVLLAFATAQGVGGDGFLAAFAAGLAVALLNVGLCDCFLEYGETTAEMAMLLAFVLFGAVLSTLFEEIPLVPALLLAGLVLLVARPLAIGLVLRRAAVSRPARAFIGWFGPRGLNSLLLALLVVQNGVAGGELILAVVGVVVTVSVVLHGASATPLSTLYGRAAARTTLEEERESTADGLFRSGSDGVKRVSPEELKRGLEGPEPPVVLDVRTRSQYEQDPDRIPDSVRVLPDQVAEWAAKQRKGQPIVAYCT